MAIEAELAPPAPVEGIAAEFVPNEAPEILGMEHERDCIAISMLDGDPTILVGHTGAGKTRLMQQMHHEARWPMRAIGGHGGVETTTLIGKPWVRDGNMDYQIGILPFCMINGIAAVFHEINALAPDVLILLHEYLDEGQITLLDAPVDHEYFVVKPHENFRLYGTMNPPELYPGTRELSPALLRRCLVRQVADLPPDLEQRAIVQQAGVTDEVAKQMVKVASDVRSQFYDQNSTFWLSTADLVQWAHKTRHLQPIEASEICLVGKTQTDADAEFVRGRVRFSFDPKAGKTPDDPVL